jgi:hypothetical protein
MLLENCAYPAQAGMLGDLWKSSNQSSAISVQGSPRSRSTTINYLVNFGLGEVKKIERDWQSK